MAKAIMIQGTASNVGKSLICAGLCRIFKQDGYKVTPFKSQNMALNSYITGDGLEIGRAQAVQAEAAMVAPSVLMNPILLKPTSDAGSQIIVNGEVRGNMTAREYFKKRAGFIPDIMRAYTTLAAEYDLVVIEGAGSPAEINLKKEDIVNMGMAKMANAPVLLVGDIDKGGVFAQLYGTTALLDQEERELIKALIVNKFRGDITLFDDGRNILADITHKPVAGVLPYLPIDIDDEDSLSEKLNNRRPGALSDIAVIRLPRISNFTDFAPLDVRYVTKTSELGQPDMVIIPGTKNTVSDLLWLRKCGLEAAIKKLASEHVLVFGICGGYQMLGESITDTHHAEGGSLLPDGGSIAGMGLLPVKTDFTPQKRRTRVNGFVLPWNADVTGYEIHMGKTVLQEGAKPFIQLENGEFDGCICNHIFGTYLHGFFDADECRNYVHTILGHKKIPAYSRAEYKEQQYDKLAAHMRKYLDMKLIYEILEAGVQ